MAIAVSSNHEQLRAASFISRYTRNMESSVGKLTSGTRLNSAADDPAGIVAASRLKTQSRTLNQASTNAQNAAAVAKAADGAYGNAIEILQRMKEIATEATDTTLEDRGGLEEEFKALNSRLSNIGSMSYGGQKLFKEYSLQIGDNASMSITMNLASNAPSSISGSVSDATNAKTAISTIDTQLTTLSKAQGKAGGWENALGYITDNLATDSSNFNSSYHMMADTNIASEMTDYVQNNIAMQSAQLILAQRNQSAYSVLNLLNP